MHCLPPSSYSQFSFSEVDFVSCPLDDSGVSVTQNSCCLQQLLVRKNECTIHAILWSSGDVNCFTKSFISVSSNIQHFQLAQTALNITSVCCIKLILMIEATNCCSYWCAVPLVLLGVV